MKRTLIIQWTIGNVERRTYHALIVNLTKARTPLVSPSMEPINLDVRIKENE
jgi:hypothetical protein